MDTCFEERSGVSWLSSIGRNYGVIMENESGFLTIVRVLHNDGSVKYYDKGGAVDGRDNHNVRLTSCSPSDPPFMKLCSASPIGECFAYADPKRVHRFRYDDASLRVMPVDGGAKISEQDFKDIKDHLWRDEKEKYRPVEQPNRRLSAAYYAVRENIERMKQEENDGAGIKPKDDGVEY